MSCEVGECVVKLTLLHVAPSGMRPNQLYYAGFFHTPHKVLLIPQAALIVAVLLFSVCRLALPISLSAIKSQGYFSKPLQIALLFRTYR